MADDDAHDSVLDDGTEDVIVEGDDPDETTVDVDVDPEALDAEAATEEPSTEDPELEAIKQRVKEMEEEAEKLKEMQSQVEKQMMSPTATTPGSSSGYPTWEEKQEADARSVHISNVDYGATAEELESHFHGCGAVNRVTILCDKWTGHPKGFAYIEFADKDAVQAAVGLDDSLFRGRQIKVAVKRTNRPGISSTNRGRRFRRGGYRPSYGYYVPRPRRFRRRSAVWYSPY